MKIFVNGQPYEVKQDSTLVELLAELGWKPTQVVTERNGAVVPRSEASSVVLAEGDHLEIILPVAGG